MKCHSCKCEYEQRKGTLRLADDHVGSLEVYNVTYFECGDCGDYLFPLETAKKIGDERDRKLEEILRSRPISEFVSAAEAGAILGISRQALHKHRRISRGFIYQLPFGEKTVYLKKSVLQFKKTGDGRFLLCALEESIPFLEQVGSTSSPFRFFADDLEPPHPEVLVTGLVGSVSTAHSRSIH